MPHAEQHYRWTWELRAPPEALWPFVSNTDRFNRDCGFPPVQAVAPPPDAKAKITNSRRLRVSALGSVIEWEESAFEWAAPVRFGVERIFHSGPVARFVLRCSLAPRPDGGTTLTYEMWITPSNLLGRLALPFKIGRQGRATIERVFNKYDEFALAGLRTSQLAQKPRLAAAADARLTEIRRQLAAQAAQPAALVNQLTRFVAEADDLAAARMRPYALAEEWQSPRRDTLQLFLHATRAGLLDFSWDLICPHCRGAKATQSSLNTLRPVAHCDTCNVDFTANFDQSVELTFSPNAAVRSVPRSDYCFGGPQVTPHVVAQQTIRAGETIVLPHALETGRYRLRLAGQPELHAFRVEPGAPAALRLNLADRSTDEPPVAPTGTLTVTNPTSSSQLALIERVAWSDLSATASEVTSLQLFRDLFSREVLRRGEQISVGTMTVVFTDLKSSTQLYREIGDAPAFGRVLTHFEILKAAVAAEGGCIVKTMGDAIMAVFPRPLPAVRALLHAQQWLARPERFALPPEISVPPSSLQPLALKVGLHLGPCLAINQNDRLDYFGTTVNLTARLCSLCTGQDLILSAAVLTDPEVAAYFAQQTDRLQLAEETVSPKGFDAEQFRITRVSAV